MIRGPEDRNVCKLESVAAAARVGRSCRLLAPRKRRVSAFALVRRPSTCSAQPTESLDARRRSADPYHVTRRRDIRNRGLDAPSAVHQHIILRHPPHLHSHLTSMTLITSQASYQAVHLPDPIDERARHTHPSKCVKLRNKKTVKLGKKGETRVWVQMSRPREGGSGGHSGDSCLLTDAGLRVTNDDCSRVKYGVSLLP